MKGTVAVFVAVMAVFAAATGGFGGGEAASTGRLVDTEAVDVTFDASADGSAFDVHEPDPENQASGVVLPRNCTL